MADADGSTAGMTDAEKAELAAKRKAAKEAKAAEKAAKEAAKAARQAERQAASTKKEAAKQQQEEPGPTLDVPSLTLRDRDARVGRGLHPVAPGDRA